jgi:hypothetical protein
MLRAPLVGGGAGSTTSVVVLVRVREPLVPAIMGVEAPDGVFAVVVTVSVEVPPPVIDVGTKVEVVLAGRPLTARLTVPAKPFTAPTVMVKPTAAPAVTSAGPDTANVKSGWGCGVAVNGAGDTAFPLIVIT